MLSLNRILIVLLTVVSAFPAGAQELLFSSLGDDIQLPAQECYKIMQDKKGYIWFSTERGLCRYSNNSLKVFDRKNGLPEESVYAMDEDAAGVMWFMTSKNRILNYSGGKLTESKYNKAYQAFETEEQLNAVPFFLDASSAGALHFANRVYAAAVNTKAHTVKRLRPQTDRANFVFEKKKGRRLLAFRKWHIAGEKEVSVKIITESGSHLLKIPNTLISSLVHWQTFTCMAKGTDFFSIDDVLVKLNADFSITTYKMPGRIFSLYTDKDQGLWVGTLKNGVFHYPDVSTMKLAHHSLKGYSVTGICEDSENGLWCSTLEKGIFYSHSKYITGYQNISGLDKRNTLLKNVNGKLFASSRGNAVFSFEHEVPRKFTLPYNEDSFHFSDLFLREHSWFACGSPILIKCGTNFSVPRMLELRTGEYAVSYQFAQTENGKLYGILQRQVIEIAPDGNVKVIYISFTGKALFALPGNLLLAGSNDGAYIVHPQSGSAKKIKGVKGNVTQIIRSCTGRIWIATKTDGLYWLDGKSMTAVSAPFSIKTAVFFDLAEDKNGTIWGATAIGVIRFTPKENSYTVSLFDTHSGLPSNEAYKLAAVNDRLYFSTFEGLFSFPLDHPPVSKAVPAIYLHSLLINGKNCGNTRSPIHVSHDRNSFRFLFDVLTFREGPEAKLVYELRGPDGRPVQKKITGHELMLENLAPGNYSLAVYSVSHDGVRSRKPVRLSIRIDHPYWLTWWFIGLVLLVSGLFVLIIVRSIISGIRKKEEAKTSMNKLIAEYQMNALQAQMNPHFIFNAINTIQGYILRKNEDEAYNYLAKFSKLIRMVLNNSQEATILLREELVILHLYVELEQLRFDNCFDFELNLSPEAEPNETYIPGMLLQPYIENAIWHGIVNLEKMRRGKLTVTISGVDDSLVITITDNGIGRELAKTFRKDINHKSMAMNLTEKRVNAMNQLKDFETAHVEISDLSDDSGNPAGTQVTIVLPVIQHYE